MSCAAEKNDTAAGIFCEKKTDGPPARTPIMGILNITPDSFSDGGKNFGEANGTDVDAVLKNAGKLIRDGADIIDIGAESTRPGHQPVSFESEIARLIPALNAVRSAFPDILISVDTCKSKVAEIACENGADIINDIWGAKFEAENDTAPMARVAAKTGVPLILMHNRAVPFSNENFWENYLSEIRGMISLAEKNGVKPDKIWLDPGFGFGKTPAQNLEVLKNLNRVCALGFPVLLGTSRKSTLGIVLDAPVNERVGGNIATAVWGIQQGAAALRVHDVGEVLPAVKMADALRAGIRWEKK